MGKSTISMAIFNSYVSLPGRVPFTGSQCLTWHLKYLNEGGWKSQVHIQLRYCYTRLGNPRHGGGADHGTCHGAWNAEGLAVFLTTLDFWRNDDIWLSMKCWYIINVSLMYHKCWSPIWLFIDKSWCWRVEGEQRRDGNNALSLEDVQQGTAPYFCWKSGMSQNRNANHDKPTHTQKDIYIYILSIYIYIYVCIHYTPLGWLDPHIVRSPWNVKSSSSSSSSSSSIVCQHQPSLTNWPRWPLSLSCWILNHDHHETPLFTPSPGGSFNSSSPVSPFFVGDPLGGCKLVYLSTSIMMLIVS